MTKDGDRAALFDNSYENKIEALKKSLTNNGSVLVDQK